MQLCDKYVEAFEYCVTNSIAAKLEKAGVKSADDLKGKTVEELTEYEGVGKVTAEKIHKAVN